MVAAGLAGDDGSRLVTLMRAMSDTPGRRARVGNTVDSRQAATRLMRTEVPPARARSFAACQFKAAARAGGGALSGQARGDDPSDIIERCCPALTPHVNW